jgi:hypothetical protein
LSSRLFIKKVFNGYEGGKEVFTRYAQGDKMRLLAKYSKLRLQSQMWSPGPLEILAGSITVSELLEPDFDLG